MDKRDNSNLLANTQKVPSKTYRLKRTPEETSELEKEFQIKVAHAFVKAKDLISDRGQGYNVKASVVDYFPNGTQDLIYEIKKKITRTENALAAEYAGKNMTVIDGKVEDSILDGINYFAFLYAYYSLEKEGVI